MAAVRVAGRARRRAEVTLVDPRAELVQRLRLHQAAAGQTVRSYAPTGLTGRGVTNVQGEACEIDVDRSLVRVRGGDGDTEQPFDSVVLATGSTIDTESVPGVREHAHSLAGPASAARLGETLRTLREGAVVAVCGGGMTGIEAAGGFAETRSDLDVRLVSARRVGHWLSSVGREELNSRLWRLGMTFVEHTPIAAVDHRLLLLGDGSELGVDAAVWCGGFAGQPLARDSGLATDDRGALLVDPTLRSTSHPQILGVGDAAAIPSLPNGAAVRMTCQAGMPAGAHAADTLAALLEGREPEPFDFGYLHQAISLGRRDALVQWVDRADRPKDKVLAGRGAALLKELVTRGVVPGIRLERQVPGAARWPSGGRPIPGLAGAVHTGSGGSA